ncbi:MAG: DUF3291 domain-containing protein [Anaerolineales bacterium]|nr:DUF3291 domain-containing protein [Anaerolineales bacterium]
MTEYHLAQLNIATLKEPLDSPAFADFVANLDRINALAETSDGYIWRLKSDDNNATSFRPLDENTIVNMSVWRDIKSLNEYVYRSAHTDIMRRRKEWFERMKEAFMVLWWIPAGHQPTIDEALKKLELLRQAGAGPEAFTFRNPFSKPVE